MDYKKMFKEATGKDAYIEPHGEMGGGGYYDSLYVEYLETKLDTIGNQASISILKTIWPEIGGNQSTRYK